LDGEKSAPPSDADWSAFISDIKALSELLILLVAAMRYLSCPAVGHPISPPIAPPFFSELSMPDVDGRDLACDNYMGPVLCATPVWLPIPWPKAATLSKRAKIGTGWTRGVQD